MAAKLHGLTWAPAKRFSVVVEYTTVNSPDEGARMAEAWTVAAFDAAQRPIVRGQEGLLTIEELCALYKRDGTSADLAWSLVPFTAEGAWRVD